MGLICMHFLVKGFYSFLLVVLFNWERTKLKPSFILWSELWLNHRRFGILFWSEAQVWKQWALIGTRARSCLQAVIEDRVQHVLIQIVLHLIFLQRQTEALGFDWQTETCPLLLVDELLKWARAGQPWRHHSVSDVRVTVWKLRPLFATLRAVQLSFLWEDMLCICLFLLPVLLWLRFFPSSQTRQTSDPTPDWLAFLQSPQ